MNRSSKLSSLLALALMLFAVLACSTGDSNTKDSSASPIPPDMKDYIGEWQGQWQSGSMKLSIAPDGGVEYERKVGSTSKSIAGGKITKFSGNDFEVESFIVTTTFKVGKPPYQNGKRWKMVVDGVEVSRKDISSGDSSSSSEKSDELKLDVAEMRKDDGNGDVSEEVVNSFSQTDKKIHCYINWDNPKADTKLKFVYIAVDAGGAKNETVKEFTLVTENELQNEAHGSLTLSKPLPKGSYQVEVYVNDKLEHTLPFRII